VAIARPNPAGAFQNPSSWGRPGDGDRVEEHVGHRQQGQVLTQSNDACFLDSAGQIAEYVFGGDDRLQAIHFLILARSLVWAGRWACRSRLARRGPGAWSLPFLPQEGEREVDALDLAEPRLLLGPSAAGQQVVLDLVEPGQQRSGQFDAVAHGDVTGLRCVVEYGDRLNPSSGGPIRSLGRVRQTPLRPASRAVPRSRSRSGRVGGSA
jgi:hypothetical protein